MRTLRRNFATLLVLLLVQLFISCGVIVGLFYKDWRSAVAYRSSPSKKNYYIIEGVTQSHCGCSDIVVKSFENKKPDFTFYYGGGLFPAKKYVFKRYKETNKVDTLIFQPVSSDDFTTPFDSLDMEIMRRIDTLITLRPNGSGLIYPVKKQEYKGYRRLK